MIGEHPRWLRPARVLAAGICIAAVLGGWFTHALEPTPVDSQQIPESLPPPPTSPNAVANEANRTRSEAAIHTTSVKGRVLWSDGTPAYRVQVAFDGMKPSLVTDLAGTYSGQLASSSTTPWQGPKPLSMRLQAPCWIDSPLVIEATVVNSGNGFCAVGDVTLPNRTDILVKVDLDDYAVEQLRADAYAHLVCVAADAAIPALPPQLGQASMGLETGTGETVLRVRHASVISFSLSAWADASHSGGDATVRRDAVSSTSPTVR